MGAASHQMVTEKRESWPTLWPKFSVGNLRVNPAKEICGPARGTVQVRDGREVFARLSLETPSLLTGNDSEMPV